MSFLSVGDSVAVLKKMDSNSIDAVVTDPPYGLAFMGKKWDYDVPSVELWCEVLRVLKPGGHLLSFGGTRTYHRMVVNVEDAGFEIRDQLAWNYGSGFPKSTNVLKSAIKQGRACECKNPTEMQRLPENISEMEVLGETSEDADLQLQMQRDQSRQRLGNVRASGKQIKNTRKLSQSSNEGLEKSCLAGRSDLQANEGKLHRSEICSMSGSVSIDGPQRRVRNGTSTCDGETSGPDVDANGSGSSQGPQHEKQSDTESRAVRKQSTTQTCGSCGKTIFDPGLGTALKPALEPIVLARKPLVGTVAENVEEWGTGALNIDGSRIEGAPWKAHTATGLGSVKFFSEGKLNEIEKSPHAQGRWPANVLFDEEAAAVLDEQSGILKSGELKGYKAKESENVAMSGKNYAREFTKSTKSEGGASRFFYVAKASKRERGGGNNHPTVKPVKLMEYLVRLVTPPGGTVLDPFMGSGTTGIAAKKLGFSFVGIEREPAYMEIAKRRIEATA